MTDQRIPCRVGVPAHRTMGWWASAPALLLVLLTPAMAEEPAAPRASPGLPVSAAQKDKTDRSIDRALRYLISKQDPEGWISVSDKPKNRAVLTAMSMLAFTAAGHEVADPTPEGRAIQKGLRYVLQADFQDEKGYWGGKDGSRMYGQAIITLACSELLGQTLDEETDQLIRKRVTKSIELILRSQQVEKRENHRGGWRYMPESADSDLSVTVWQLMALRSARNAGLNVPQKAINDAADYIRRSYLTPDASADQTKSGFLYMIKPDEKPTPSSTSMGLLSLQLCGEHDSAIVRSATNWLVEHPPAWGNAWVFYGSYYYSQAMFQRGGQYAARARQVTGDLLLSEQKADGSWEAADAPEKWEGPIYATSMSVLALAVKYHYLPIYQR